MRAAAVVEMDMVAGETGGVRLPALLVGRVWAKQSHMRKLVDTVTVRLATYAMDE